MYDYPIAQASPLVNAILQTLLLFICPFVVAILLGGSLGMWLFFKRHPLLAGRARPLFAIGPLPYARTMIYLGLLPMLLLLVLCIPGMAASTVVLVLLSLGAAVHLAFHMYGELYTLDESILEMALASGLDYPAMIRRVLLPLGKNRIFHAVCETALFLLAMETVAGCVADVGLAGLAISSGSAGNVLILLLGLLLLAPLFLLIGWLSSHFAKKCGKPS